MEKLMQFAWQHRLAVIRDGATTAGAPLRVLNPGLLNTDAGPDFFNASVRVGADTWCGNVEIHHRASDWTRHHHDTDPAYHSVILHVVAVDDAEIRRPDGSVIPQAVMEIAPGAADSYRALAAGAPGPALPCRDGLRSIPRVYVADWLTALAVERVYVKSERCAAIAAEAGGAWEEAAYVTLARALGFGLNSEPFELTARATPLNILLKHRDNPLSVEAMLFGQAGLIPDPLIGEDPYVEALRQEYMFMSAKFGLRSPRPRWKMARTRPQNLPYRRLALLARLVADGFGLMGALVNAPSPDAVRSLFNRPLRGYWAAHYTFAPSRAEAFPRVLSDTSLNTLLINAAVPLLHARAAGRGDEAAMERATDLLMALPPEDNQVSRLFTDAGLPCRDAFASQALIQLRREYCEASKCVYCRFGRRLLAAAMRQAPRV